ncbi:PaaI family thioesterase [Streptomyces sp. URMC 124]|uniref:PaaI family thioesterase n=1 Tax=Streptomyces sp. URMC 124 TaxID=3423405 RepID=UPI003F1A410A
MSRPSADPRAPESAFVAAAGLVVTEVSPTRVRGHIALGPDHHTPWGIVNGGVYTTAVESAASLGASEAAGPGRHAVAVHISTDLLRSRTEGRAEVVAEAVHQGRTQQLWTVTVSDEQPLARGQVRLQNVSAGTGTGTGTGTGGEQV